MLRYANFLGKTIIILNQMFDALYLIAYGHGSVPPSLGKLVSNNFGNKSAVAALWANTAINKKYAAAHRKRR